MVLRGICQSVLVEMGYQIVNFNFVQRSIGNVWLRFVLLCLARLVLSSVKFGFVDAKFSDGSVLYRTVLNR